MSELILVAVIMAAFGIGCAFGIFKEKRRYGNRVDTVLSGIDLAGSKIKFHDDLMPICKNQHDFDYMGDTNYD